MASWRYPNRHAEMLHAGINENMQPWAETGAGNFCLPCFAAMMAPRDDEVFALPEPERAPGS